MKYLAIYHYFEIWLNETRVLHRTQVYENRVPEKCDVVVEVDLAFYNLNVHVELEFYKIWVPLKIDLVLCVWDMLKWRKAEGKEEKNYTKESTSVGHAELEFQ